MIIVWKKNKLVKQKCYTVQIDLYKLILARQYEKGGVFFNNHITV